MQTTKKGKRVKKTRHPVNYRNPPELYGHYAMWADKVDFEDQRNVAFWFIKKMKLDDQFEEFVLANVDLRNKDD
jgi:hypothetical protein